MQATQKVGVVSGAAVVVENQLVAAREGLVEGEVHSVVHRVDGAEVVRARDLGTPLRVKLQKEAAV